jgi:hypothetical protein
MEKTNEYYESLDKRTKEYKEWKASFEAVQEEKPDGLGDVVEKFTEATGIKKAVKWLAGDDCGCDERKEKLNEMFPSLKPECLTQEEFEILTNYSKNNKSTFRHIEQVQILKIYNRVFHQNEKTTNCSPCFAGKYNKLMKILNEYDV